MRFREDAPRVTNLVGSRCCGVGRVIALVVALVVRVAQTYNEECVATTRWMR